MEGSRRHPLGATGQGRSNGQILSAPTGGWRQVSAQVKEGIQEDNLSILAGGTAFFLLLGLVPGLAALISVYGLIANPSDIQAQFNALSQMIPTEAKTLLEGQMTRIASQRHTTGITALVSLGLALWGGGAALKTVINALNIIWHEEEKRSYVRLTATALGLTAAFVLLGVLSIGLIVVLPPVLGHLPLADVSRTIVSLLRWPLLLIVALIALAVLYRYAPSRNKPEWRWLSPGAVVATVLWVAGSALFALYAQHFGNYNKTYGSLAAVVVLMLWLYISAFALLLGAEINAQIEPTAVNESEPRADRRTSIREQEP